VAGDRRRDERPAEVEAGDAPVIDVDVEPAARRQRDSERRGHPSHEPDE
jgi:hypothetical protein